MLDIVKSYTLYLNTRQANSGNSNNCTFIFTPAITLTNTMNRFVISTPFIEIPYSFSQVNVNNNVLGYTYVDNQGGGITFNRTITIPIGNYNINQLITQFIASLLTDIYIGKPTSTITTSSFLISYNSATGLTTFFILPTLGYTITITLKFSTSFVLGLMFGFNATNDVFGTAVKLTSPNKVNCNPITSIYLRSDSLKFQSNFEAVISPYENSDIIAKIPVTTLPNSIIYFRSEIKSIISNKELPSLNLYLSDNLSTTFTLDMSGLPYGVMIQIDEVQLKPTNAFQDKLGSGILAPPIDLIQQRDSILEELIIKKEKLEKEIQSSKENNRLEVDNLK